jgi:anaerobic selenocysteine-containing dehydrogenase
VNPIILVKREVQKVSYCRICQASCGVLVEVNENRILSIIGDADNPLSQGFTCPRSAVAGSCITVRSAC